MRLQNVFEALADPNRRKILALLKDGHLGVSEIAESFDISGASLSHHLNKLKHADLVYAKRNGRQMIYHLHTSVFEDLGMFMADFLKVGEDNDG